MKYTIHKILVISLVVLLNTIGAYAQVWDLKDKIVASDRDKGDTYGYSTAISNGYAFVGAYQESHDSAGGKHIHGSGSVYIYKRDLRKNWSQVQKITASDRTAGSYFGWSVDVHKNIAVVGAENDDYDSSGSNKVIGAGSAYIFEKNKFGKWIQVKKISAWDRDYTDRFGYAVAVSGNYVAVSAVAEDEDANAKNKKVDAGSVYIYHRDSSGIWRFSQKLVASDRDVQDAYGVSLSIDDNQLFIGAYYEDHDTSGKNTRNYAGSVYVYQLDSSGLWKETQKLVASDRGALDYFGVSVSISDSNAVVGAYRESMNSKGKDSLHYAGAAYTFKMNPNGKWTETQKLTASDRAENDRFGWASDISEDQLIIGARYSDLDESGKNPLDRAGSAYVFQRDSTGTWNESRKMVGMDRARDDAFGKAVSIDDGFACIGSFQDDEDQNGKNGLINAGSAYIFGFCSPTQDSITIRTCDPYTVPSKKRTYFKDGQYIDTIQNTRDCDSILYINLLFKKKSITTIHVKACDSFISPSGLFKWTQSGTYYDDLVKSNGCDSTLIIKLTISESSSDTIDISSCQPTVSPSGRHLWTISGRFADTLVNSSGCDSLLTVNFTLLPSSQNAIQAEVCNWYRSPSGNHIWDSSGSYLDTIPNSIGCDSIISIQLTVHHSASDTIKAAKCSSHLSPSGKYLWTSSGLWSDTLIDQFGCDSLIFVDLIIHGTDRDTFEINGCSEYVSPSGKYTWTTNGQYADTLVSSSGCDSILTINLDMVKIDTSLVLSNASLTSQQDSADYQWLDCSSNFTPLAGEEGRTFIPGSSGVYAVEITKLGCTDTSNCFQFKHTALPTLSLGGLVDVYPNPTTKFINLKFDKTINSAQLVVRNSLGQIVSKSNYQNVDSVKHHLDTPVGVYILEVSIDMQYMGVVRVVRL